MKKQKSSTIPADPNTAFQNLVRALIVADGVPAFSALFLILKLIMMHSAEMSVLTRNAGAIDHTCIPQVKGTMRAKDRSEKSRALTKEICGSERRHTNHE
jgi:hypothetical protein